MSRFFLISNWAYGWHFELVFSTNDCALVFVRQPCNCPCPIPCISKYGEPVSVLDFGLNFKPVCGMLWIRSTPLHRAASTGQLGVVCAHFYCHICLRNLWIVAATHVSFLPSTALYVVIERFFHSARLRIPEHVSWNFTEGHKVICYYLAWESESVVHTCIQNVLFST